MLVKGTEDYKRAGEFANELQRIANYERWNNNTLYDMFINDYYNLMNSIEEVGVFASKIAKTQIENFMNDKKQFKIAYLSSKQAWILACSMVENNIEMIK